jgi:subtilisin-like proprotein convertase family protein
MSGKGRRAPLLVAISTTVYAAAIFVASVCVFAVPAVEAKAKKAVKTFTLERCVNAAQPIPDSGAVGDYVPVSVPTGPMPYGARVVDVDASVRVSHPAVGELDVLLVAPVGIVIPLTLGNGGSGDNLGTGAAGCGGVFTSFDDEAPSSIRAVTAANAPFAGGFQPEQPLALANKTFADGDWRFYVDDTSASNPGLLEAAAFKLTWRKRKKKHR